MGGGEVQMQDLAPLPYTDRLVTTVEGRDPGPDVLPG